MGNMLHPDLLESYRQIATPFFVMSLMCLFSLIASIAYYFAHLKYQSFLLVEPESDEADSGAGFIEEIAEVEQESQSEEIGKPIIESQAGGQQQQQAGIDFANVKFDFGSVKYFNQSFWLLCLIFVLLSNCFRQFNNILTEILMNRFLYDLDYASQLTIVPEVAFVIVAPFLSRVVEAKGAKPLFIFGCAFCYFTAFTWMYLLPVESSIQVIACLFLVGVGLSIFICALVTSIAISVPKAGVGMAFSLITCIENTAFTLFPIYFGRVA